MYMHIYIYICKDTRKMFHHLLKVISTSAIESDSLIYSIDVALVTS